MKSKLVFMFISTLFLVGCFADAPTGNVTILESNDFLDDENHIIETTTLEGFFEIIEEQNNPTKIDEDDESLNKPKNDKEMRHIFIFASSTDVRAQIMSSIANDLAKDDYEYIYLVEDFSNARGSYDSYIDGDKVGDLPTDGEFYELLLEEFDIKTPVNNKPEDQINYKQKYDDLVESEQPDYEKDDEGYIAGADRIGTGFTVSYANGEYKDSYLWNEWILKNPSDIYDFDEEDNDKKYLNDNAKEFVDSLKSEYNEIFKI